MMDQFLNEYDKFSKNEKIDSLNEDNKIALFSVFCEAMSRKKAPTITQAPTPVPAPTQAAPKAESTRPRRGSRQATDKQVTLIRSLQKQGHIPADLDIESLSVKGASAEIDSGIQTQRAAKNKKAAQPAAPKPAVKPTPQPAATVEPVGEGVVESKEFIGGYSHSSGGHESQGHFWE